jgi:hypothetical protein
MEELEDGLSGKRSPKPTAKPLNIKNGEAYSLATAIAEHTGKNLTRVVVDALRHEKQRVVPRAVDRRKLDTVLKQAHALPDLDPRSSSEIMNDLYDEHGLPR